MLKVRVHEKERACCWKWEWMREGELDVENGSECEEGVGCWIESEWGEVIRMLKVRVHEKERACCWKWEWMREGELDVENKSCTKVKGRSFSFLFVLSSANNKANKYPLGTFSVLI